MKNLFQKHYAIYFSKIINPLMSGGNKKVTHT